MNDIEDAADTRVRVPLAGKAIRLEQLDAETGGHGLCGGEDEVVVAEGSPLTEAELVDAINGHVPVVAASVAEQVDALPDPTVDLDGFKAGLKSLLGVE